MRFWLYSKAVFYRERLILWRLSASEFFQSEHVSKRLKYSFSMLGMLLLIGTIGYKFIGGEGTTLFDGLYMTVITISTIGFEEVIDLKNNMAGRVFTMLIAFSGIGFVTYMFSALAALLIEGDLRQKFIKNKAQRIISRMENHYIICGVGRVGQQVVQELLLTQRDFSFGDLEEEKVKDLSEEFKLTCGLEGDCTEDDFLIKLGVEQAKGIFVSTDNDNTNLVICLTAKQLNPSVRVVAMCKDPSYTKKMKSVGADRVISPFFIGGERMATEMLRPEATNFLESMLHDNDESLRFEQIAVSSKLLGKKLSSLRLEEFDSTLLIAIKDETSKWHINPSEEQVIEEHTVLIVLTNAEERKELEFRCMG